MSLNHERVQPILRVDGLNVELKIRNKQKKLVENVSFEVEPGQCLGILGESGSGKSMTVKAILGLLDRQFRIEGQAWFEGKDLCRAGRDELRRLRGQKIGMVLQNPMTCFDPLYRIGSQTGRDLCSPYRLGSGKDPGDFPGSIGKNENS